MSLIERIAHTQGITDFKAAQDDIKFMVYKLALEEIFGILGQDIRTLPKTSLEEIQDTLNEIENGFYVFLNSGTVRQIDLRENMSILFQAASDLYAALSLLETIGKNDSFFRYVLLCRMHINELIHRLV